MSDRSRIVVIDYTNYRLERRERRILPVTLFYGSSPWHPGEQWFLRALDVEKKETRDFAMADIHGWRAE
jgi:predicted DNA-binding transcriptional regulator YafY